MQLLILTNTQPETVRVFISEIVNLPMTTQFFAVKSAVNQYGVEFTRQEIAVRYLQGTLPTFTRFSNWLDASQ